jgi:diguanylate cyclase (GGDEF)-like protein
MNQRTRGLIWAVAFFVAELAALKLQAPSDATVLLVINTALMLWLIYRCGYLPGAMMLAFSLYLLGRWSIESVFEPAYWAAGLVWVLPFTFVYRQRYLAKEASNKHIFERERFEEEKNEIERQAEDMELRLKNSRHWRDRIAPLCNFAEDLLTTLKPQEVTSTLLHNVPELIPSTERFYCYRTEGANLEESQLLAAIPEDLIGSAYALDEFDRMCYQDGRPMLTEDTTHSTVQPAKGPAARSVLIAPLIVRMRSEANAAGIRHTLGALRVESSKPGAFDRSDLDILNIISDTTARALLNTDLYMETETLAVRDALTGLLLRQVFFERATQDLSRTRRSGSSVSFVMFDIDDFKKLNDKWGHTAGDLVLKRLAEMLQASLQPGEIACRYGGEEMCTLLHNDVLRAERRATRFRTNFGQEKFLFPNTDGKLEEVHVTLSGGIAAFPLHAEEIVGLIQQADRALYRAKRMGKDRVLTARSR